MFVDDHPIVVRAVAHGLSAEGYSVLSAAGVVDALHLLNRSKPAALITDWHLPDGTGADVICLGRNRNPTVPVLIQTASPGRVKAQGFPVLAKHPVQKLVDWLRGLGLGG